MLYSSKASLGKYLGVDRTTITRMINRKEVKVIYALSGKKYYVHVINLIKELVD